ncbi:outer membrane beta-barrel family protein, partial [Xanthovirga aplysinae]|uniref:outer membrane beta-barrel family protein n=1 Tax=Xanthovirga aplysinae TaxID=2529853 RepID=UPI0012BBB9FA
ESITEREPISSSISSLYSDKKFDGVWKGHQAEAGLDVDVRKSFAVGFRYKLNTFKFHTNEGNQDIYRSAENKQDSAFYTTESYDESEIGHQVNLFLDKKLDTLGRKISFNYNYNYFDNAGDGVLNNFYLTEDQQLGENYQIFGFYYPTLFTLHVGRLDVELPNIMKLDWEGGVKFSYINTHDELLYFPNELEMMDTERSSTFDYTEKVLAFYTAIQKEWNKWMLKGGLRAEHTQREGSSYFFPGNSLFRRNYWSLFPSLFAQRKLNENHDFTLSYARRIERPGFNTMRSLKVYSGPYTYFTGDPSLLPTFINSIETTYTWKNSYSLNLGYQHFKDIVQNLPFIDEEGLNGNTFQNLGSQHLFFVTLNLPFTISSWWTFQFDLNAYRKVIKADENLENKDNYLKISMNQVFTLPKKYTLMIDGNYYSGFTSGLYTYRPFGALSLTAKKSVWNEQGTISVQISNLLNSRNSERTAITPDFEEKFLYQGPAQTLQVSFAYNFSKGLEFKSRKRESAAEEEESRR